MMTSVVATPVAATVTTVAQTPEATALVPMVAVPLANILATVESTCVEVTVLAVIIAPVTEEQVPSAVAEAMAVTTWFVQVVVPESVGFGYVPPSAPPAAPEGGPPPVEPESARHG